MTLKEYREKANKTQEDVASMSGISRTTYTNIENGKTHPSVGTAKTIAAYLKFDWIAFFEKGAADDDFI